MSHPLFGIGARVSSRTTTDKLWHWIGRIALISMGLALLVWSGQFLDTHEFPKQAALTIGAAILFPVAGWAFWRDDRHRPLSWVMWVASWLVMSAALLAWIMSPDRWMAFFGAFGSTVGSVLGMILAVGAFWLGSAMHVVGWKGAHRAWWWTLVGLTILGLAQRYGWIDISPGGIASPLFSPLGQTSLLAWAWLVSVPWLLWNEELSRHERAAYLCVALIWLIALDGTLFWVWMAGTSLVGMAIAALLRLPLHRWQKILHGVAIGVSVLGMIVAVPQPEHLPRALHPSMQQEREVLRAAWQNGRWLTGAGQTQWSAIFERVRPRELNQGSLFGLRFESGSSWMLTIAGEQGVVGLVAWIFLMLVAMIQGIMLVRRDGTRWPRVYVALCGLATLWVMYPSIWMLVLLFWWVGYALSDTYEWPEYARRGWMAQLVVVGAACFVSLGWLLPRMLSEAQAQAAQEGSSGQHRALMREAAARISWVPLYQTLALEQDVGAIRAALQTGGTQNEEVQSMVEQALDASKQAVTRWPHQSDMWLLRASVYSVIASMAKGADQFAIQAYQEGMARAPQNPLFPLGIGRIYALRAEEPVPATTSTAEGVAKYRLEQRRLAAQWLKRAREMKSDDATITYLYATQLAKAGDIQGALPLLQELVERLPNRLDIQLEYAALLAAAGRHEEAIRFVQPMPSTHELYTVSRRLLTDWYVVREAWPEALAAWKQIPAADQQTAAFRERLNALQLKAQGSR